MRRLTLTLFTFCLLAACGPTVSTPGDVLPVEAGHIVAVATATAAAQATANSLATATDQSSRATATTARQATLDALEGRQTEAALQLTQGAGAAIATDGAAVKTQSAADTKAWDTPTAAAIRTQAAVAASDRTRQQAQAADVAEFWKTIRWVIVAVLAVGGVVACVLLWIWGRARIRMEELRTKAAIAQAAFRLLTPGHWAEWAPDEGYQVYTLPGQLSEPAAIVENAPTSPNQAYHWRQAVRMFCWWGERYGFGIEQLGASGAGAVTDPTWRAMTRLLKDAGVLANMRIEKDGQPQKGRATAWADGWSFVRLADELSSGRLALPLPTDADAPKVSFTVPTEQQN